MRGALGRRQFGAAQVLIDLEQFGFIVAQIVVDLGADDLMPALARRFEPVKAGHQFVTGAAPRTEIDCSTLRAVMDSTSQSTTSGRNLRRRSGGTAMASTSMLQTARAPLGAVGPCGIA